VGATRSVCKAADRLWLNRPAPLRVPIVRGQRNHVTTSWQIEQLPLALGTNHKALPSMKSQVQAFRTREQAARTAPTAMVFAPSKDGISHNEIEDAQPEHLAAGATVLLHAMLSKAGMA
jgi:hypothetical protein